MAKRYTLNDARQDQSESLYVLSNASRLTRKQTSLIINHTSRDSGDIRAIPIPMTFNPIDLSTFAPKDELLRNTILLSQINSGMLTLISEEEALTLLDTPEGRRESDRLEVERLHKLQGTLQYDKINPEMTEDFKSTFPKEMFQQDKVAPGDVDEQLKGISPPIVEIMNSGMDDEARAANITNLSRQGLLSEADKKFIRSNTSDVNIRRIVA